MIFQRVNFGYGQLAATLTPVSTTMVMSTGHYLPIDPGPMRLVIWNAALYPIPISDPSFEVVTAYYTGTTNVYTIIRAQEDTIAHSHSINDRVAMTYTKGVSSSDLFVLGSKELNEDNIGHQKSVIYNALLDRLEYGTAGGGGGGTTIATKTFYVDKNRTDIYTQDGSLASPFKSIMAAVNKIIANGDNAVNSYLIEIAPGVYHEQIILESLSLYNVYFHGNGEVIIQPFPGGGSSSGVPTSSWWLSSSNIPSSSGGWGGPVYSVKSTANNMNLLTLHFSNIDFMAPFLITGQCGTTAFSDVLVEDSNFISESNSGFAGGEIIASYMNNFCMTNVRSTENISLTNVWWSYYESCHLEGDWVFILDDTCSPQSGTDNMALFNGTYLQGTPRFERELSSEEALATLTFVTSGSRIGRGNPVLVPPGITVYAQSSFLRGTWTNNGLVILANATVQSLSPLSIGVLQITDQPASQIYNDSSVPGYSVKEALDALQSGVLVASKYYDRMMLMGG